MMDFNLNFFGLLLQLYSHRFTQASTIAGETWQDLIDLSRDLIDSINSNVSTPIWNAQTKRRYLKILVPAMLRRTKIIKMC